MKDIKDLLKYIRNKLKHLSFIKLFFVITTPFLITFWLFPFWQKTNLSAGIADELIYISDEEIVKPSFKTIVADAIQIALNLRWYDVYIVNKNTLESVRECPKIEEPYLTIIFDEGNPEKYSESSFDRIIDLYSGEIKGFDDGTKVAHIGEGGYVIAEVSFNSESKFTYSGTDGFAIRAVGLGCLDENLNPIKNIEPNYDIYVKPNINAWLAKLLFIWIFWILFLPSAIATWKLCQKK